MREQLFKRLQELKAEFESGQKKLAELEAQVHNLRNTLLRISGAVQVLDEELSRSEEQKIVPHPEDSDDHKAKGKSEANRQNIAISQN